MEDIKLLETCPACGENLTLMASINMINNRNYLVKRCLKCGNYPVVELVEVQSSRPNCNSAIKTATGQCNGYCHSDDDDEPIDTCKECKKYCDYGIE